MQTASLVNSSPAVRPVAKALPSARQVGRHGTRAAPVSHPRRTSACGRVPCGVRLTARCRRDPRSRRARPGIATLLAGCATPGTVRRNRRIQGLRGRHDLVPDLSLRRTGARLVRERSGCASGGPGAQSQGIFCHHGRRIPSGWQPRQGLCRTEIGPGVVLKPRGVRLGRPSCWPTK